jgi:filamentous hemagglutinin
VGFGRDSDSQRSTTQAAISDIAGNKSARTGDAETGLVNRFDAERVQKEIDAQTQITQTFSTYAAKGVGDYAQSQLNQANNLKVEADQLGNSPEDQQRALQLRAEAKQIEDQWGEGGSYRIALHTLTGGLSGGLSGALGGAATATAAPLLNDLQVNLSNTLKLAGASDEVADGIAQGISTVTAAGIGASVGMASGNGLAGAATGVNVDANNRQLHPTEIQWIQAQSNSFAKKLYGTDKPTSAQIAQAQQYLVYAGLGNISDSDQKANVLQGMQKDENFIEAKKFLNNQPDVFINDQGKAQRVFTVQGGEFYDPLKYSQYNADPAYRDFMWASAGLNYAPPANASAQEKIIYEQRESERLARDFKGALPGLIPGVMAVGTGVVLNRTPAVKSVAGSKLESSPGATTVTADRAGTVGKVGAKEEGIIVRNFAEGAEPNLSVNFNQQNKHIVGTNEYKTAGQLTQRSPLDSDVDPQILVNQYAGTGQVANKVPLGQPGSVERIKTNQIVGTYYENGMAVGPTKNFTIRYGKDGVHIIPARP